MTPIGGVIVGTGIGGLHTEHSFRTVAAPLAFLTVTSVSGMLVSTPLGIIDACQYQQRYQHSSRIANKGRRTMATAVTNAKLLVL